MPTRKGIKLLYCSSLSLPNRASKKNPAGLMGFIPMTLHSTFWSNRLPAHSCSQNEVNVFCPPTCVSGERGGEGEEREWGGASAHHDPLQGGRGPGSEPAEGPQTGHHKVQVSPLPGEASRNHTDEPTDRQTESWWHRARSLALKNQVRHDQAWSPRGWVIVTC